MAAIDCNNINQTVNELLVAFADCNKIKNSDLTKLVELVSAVNTCANGGVDYNTLVTEVYDSPQIVTFPIDSFHSYSLAVMEGDIEYAGLILTKGTSKSIEYTTLNQTEVTFTVNPGSSVLFEYLIETV